MGFGMYRKSRHAKSPASTDIDNDSEEEIGVVSTERSQQVHRHYMPEKIRILEL